jgi:hypothetical protein
MCSKLKSKKVFFVKLSKQQKKEFFSNLAKRFALSPPWLPGL